MCVCVVCVYVCVCKRARAKEHVIITNKKRRYIIARFLYNQYHEESNSENSAVGVRTRLLWCHGVARSPQRHRNYTLHLRKDSNDHFTIWIIEKWCIEQILTHKHNHFVAYWTGNSENKLISSSICNKMVSVCGLEFVLYIDFSIIQIVKWSLESFRKWRV